LAEGNRTPFDIPEAESELVAGYVTEYSGMRFLFFFFAEWGNLYVIGAVATTLFLGGWQIPPITDHPVLVGILQFVVFFVKAYLWVFVAMWVRATLPRVRVDQLMSLCWKYMVPLSFLCLLGTAVWMLIWPQGNRAISMSMFVLGLAILALFLVRVSYQIRHSRPALYFRPYI
jgi:NADH-quinone oxidoreductase subunit H